MAPKTKGRYARPTVWRPPAATRGVGAGAAGLASGKEALGKDALGGDARGTAAQGSAGWQAGMRRRAVRRRQIALAGCGLARQFGKVADRRRRRSPARRSIRPLRGRRLNPSRQRAGCASRARRRAVLRQRGCGCRRRCPRWCWFWLASGVGAARRCSGTGLGAGAGMSANAASGFGTGWHGFGCRRRSRHGPLRGKPRWPLTWPAEPSGATPSSMAAANRTPSMQHVNQPVRPGTPSAATRNAPPPTPIQTQRPVANAAEAHRRPGISGSRAPSFSRPAATTERVTPPASVQETLRSIEENAARWTTIAGASLARRTGPETIRITSDAPATPVAEDVALEPPVATSTPMPANEAATAGKSSAHPVEPAAQAPVAIPELAEPVNWPIVPPEAGPPAIDARRWIAAASAAMPGTERERICTACAVHDSRDRPSRASASTAAQAPATPQSNAQPTASAPSEDAIEAPVARSPLAAAEPLRSRCWQTRPRAQTVTRHRPPRRRHQPLQQTKPPCPAPNPSQRRQRRRRPTLATSGIVAQSTTMATPTANVDPTAPRRRPHRQRTSSSTKRSRHGKRKSTPPLRARCRVTDRACACSHRNSRAGLPLTRAEQALRRPRHRPKPQRQRPHPPRRHRTSCASLALLRRT